MQLREAASAWRASCADRRPDACRPTTRPTTPRAKCRRPSATYWSISSPRWSGSDAQGPRHPLPGRQGRPRRQGRQLRRPDRRRRSGRGGDGLRCGRRGRALLPRHHRVVGQSRDDLRRRRAHGRALLHAADGGRRREERRRYQETAARRRRQGVDQHSRGEEPGFRRRGGGQVRQPVHRGCHRRQEGFRRPARPTAGRFLRMAGARTPASTRWSLHARSSTWAPARSC